MRPWESCLTTTLPAWAESKSRFLVGRKGLNRPMLDAVSICVLLLIDHIKVAEPSGAPAIREALVVDASLEASSGLGKVRAAGTSGGALAAVGRAGGSSASPSRTRPRPTRPAGRVNRRFIEDPFPYWPAPARCTRTGPNWVPLSAQANKPTWPALKTLLATSKIGWPLIQTCWRPAVLCTRRVCQISGS